MASQEDDNKLVCNANVNNGQERNFVTVYKKLDGTLNNKSETYSNKIESLIEVWKIIGQCNLDNPDLQYIVQIIDWAKLHTLNIVLTGEWKKVKDQYQEALLDEVKKSQNELTKINSAFYTRCQKLADVINNPWSDPTLEYLVQTSDADVGPKEIEFFCVETAYLTSVRLKKLCESQCEDLALNLVKAFMKCYRLSQTENFNLNATETQVWFIFDIYVALLFKFKENDSLLELLKGLSLEEGLNLIKRFAKKRVKISKVWKNCLRIAILASQVYISSAIIKPIDDVRDILKSLLEAYVCLSTSESFLKDVMESIRSINRLADTAAHIYIVCGVFQQHFGIEMKAFTIELYIRALTTDMNNLERQKTDNNSEKAVEITKRLATGFSNLADILQDNVNVSRECVLTAFSLQPTNELLKKIEEYAKECGFEVLDTGQDWKCKLHPPVLSTDELAWRCTACGDWMCKPQLNVPLNTNTALNEALTEDKLGITHELCDDLVVLLSSPRYQVFSWLLNWPDLQRLCVMYLNDPERTKNLVTELKFVDIDYSIFAGIKKEPVDDYAGIERGYEQYLDHDFMSDDQISTISEDTASQESRPYSLGSDGAGDTQYYLPVVAQHKSDPNILKSLRMFRPNLKRSRANQAETNVPEKVFKSSDTFDFAIPSSSKHMNNHGYSPYVWPQQVGVVGSNPQYYIPNLEKKDSSCNSRNSTASNPHPFSYSTTTPQRHRTYPMSQSKLKTYPDSTYYKTYPGKAELNKETCQTAPFDLSTTETKPNSKNGLVATLRPSGMQVATKDNTSGNTETNQTAEEILCGSQHNKEYTRKGHLPVHQSHSDPKILDSILCSAQPQSPPLKQQRITNQEKSNTSSTTQINPNTLQSSSTSSNSAKRANKVASPTTCLDVGGPFSIKDILLQEPHQLVLDFSNKYVEDFEQKRFDAGQCFDPSQCINLTHCFDNTHTPLDSDKDEDGNVSDGVESDSQVELDAAFRKTKFARRKTRKRNATPLMRTVRTRSLSRMELEFNNPKRNTRTPFKSPLRAKYDSYPDTGSDSQFDEDDHYTNCCIDLFKNNGLLDKRKTSSKERTNKKPASESFKSKPNKSVNMKKRRKSKTVDTYLNKTVNIRDGLPKIFSKEVKIVLHRLSATDLSKYFIKNLDCKKTNADRNVVKKEEIKHHSMEPYVKLYKLGTCNEAKVEASEKIAKRDSNFDAVIKNNPRVVLERLPTDINYVRSVLANVPGLHDTELIRPVNVNHIVNVVQLAGGRTTTAVPVVQNAQTSTQVTPHIQRIGQPRGEKPQPEQPDNRDNLAPVVATPATTSSVKPSTSQPSALINILSQQIIRPGQSNCVRTRPSPLINILSQQIIKPSGQIINKTTTSSAQTTEPQVNNVSKTVTIADQTPTTTNSVKNAVKTVPTTQPTGQSTILQFICKSTLPKFQQAFGKTIYQNSTESTESNTTSTENTSTSVATEGSKKVAVKNSTVNIQPIQGSVIYTRQVPVGQTINLIPPNRGQVFRIAASNSDQISLVKDTVIHGKMSALLAAALQGKKTETHADAEVNTEEGGNRVAISRPTLVQNARIVKPVLQIPSNVIRTSPQTNLSSTTLEQLREFDMVYKQIKERSTTSTPAETSNQSETSETSPQRISVTYVNQNQKFTQLSPVVVVSSYCNLQPAASPALSVTSQGSSSPCVTPAPTPTLPKLSSKGSKGKTVKNATVHTSKASPIPKPQQKPQEDEHTTQRIFDILAEYAEQLRNSPDLNNKPAPRRRSNPPSNPNQNSKRKKGSSSKKSGQCSSMISESDMDDQRTMGSEDSSCGVVQLSVKDDDQPLSQNQTESNDNSTNARQLILTDGNTHTRNLIITDTTMGEALKIPNTAVLVPGNYIMPVSMVKGGQQIAVVSGGSKILATVPARSGPNMLLFQSFLNQNRKPGGVSTVKYSTLQPFSGISSQSLAGVSAQPPVILPHNSHNLTAVTLGQTLTMKKIEDTGDRVNTELLLTIAQPRDNINLESSPQPDSSTGVLTNNISSTKLDETIKRSDRSTEKGFHPYQKTIITGPIATSVIAQASCIRDKSEEAPTHQPSIIALNITADNTTKEESSKAVERVQSVLVAACTSNGPMLSHTPPRYRKPVECTPNNRETLKEEYLHNGEKQNNNEQKHYTTTVYYPNKSKKISANPPRLDRELQQLCLQRKQAALERELRLQKSLSEECEDLGVDEPSTSDLFPEADLLFDSNHSPSFDQSNQDLSRRMSNQDAKDKPSMVLYSDDDNSSSLRNDFLFESVEYQTENELEYEQSRQLTNGQSSTSNESGSSCEDGTLLRNCASMSDVTLNSPVSPDFVDNTPPSINKYKFKYSNRNRKGERHKQIETWTAEVSSSEDTTGSAELGKTSQSPIPCADKHSCDEDLSDGSYKLVRVAILKNDLIRDDESCEESHCEEDLDSPSGRGARRSVKKLCSCCNGTQDGNSRKRPSSRPHTPAPHKKAFSTKKR